MEKTIIITGGSRGIGAATARLAATKGYSVCINYHQNRTAAEAVADDILKAGGKALVVQGDVGLEQDVERLFKTVDREWGRLDVLINNAGVLERQIRVEEIDAARLARIFAANVTGTFLCCREAVLRMSTRRGGAGGTIVNVSSVAARLGAPNEYVDYAAAKAAIEALTIGLSKETATEGIRVNGVRPGVIYTEIHASGGEPNRVDRVKASTPMQRGGQADEVAFAILWLASEEASYTTGAFLDVSGGR
jgi:NAD(P)-dependent dehydrogenase (short-subunit alcohol dehydrogenase family)